MAYILEPSPRSEKKLRVTTPWGKKVDFGASGYSDYTLHKDPSRKNNYISRHASRENWTQTGTDTAGFWSRWILWNLPDFNESVRDTERRFGISIDTSAINGKPASQQIPQQIPAFVPTGLVPISTLPPIYSPGPLGGSLPGPLPTSSFSIPMSSLPPVPSSPRSPRSMAPTYVPSNVPSYSSIPHVKSILDDYLGCIEEATIRKENGKLKLCPHGYCTVKLTEDVYPSYSANLRASKICAGEEEDYEGNVENYYLLYK